MRYPDWFKAQVVEAVTLRGLSYLQAAQLYDLVEDTIRRWVNAADTPVGLDRVEALEHRLARIEHYLALAEQLRNQRAGKPWTLRERGNGHNGHETMCVRLDAGAPSLDGEGANGS
jgi:transposase-like protein